MDMKRQISGVSQPAAGFTSKEDERTGDDWFSSACDDFVVALFGADEHVASGEKPEFRFHETEQVQDWCLAKIVF